MAENSIALPRTTGDPVLKLTVTVWLDADVTTPMNTVAYTLSAGHRAGATSTVHVTLLLDRDAAHSDADTVMISHRMKSPAPEGVRVKVDEVNGTAEPTAANVTGTPCQRQPPGRPDSARVRARESASR